MRPGSTPTGLVPGLVPGLVLTLCAFLACALAAQTPLLPHVGDEPGRNVSIELFAELEELARIVDISYCVGTTGIQKPFQCASRCQDFGEFELVTTWNTGPLMSDSCGYVALDHSPSSPRILVAFRGTYSIANTIVDLSTIPQEYVPYPPDDEGSSQDEPKCDNCTVHSGFLTSWMHTRPYILPHLESLVPRLPEYRVTLVGHSLGGAVAALASLDFHQRGWQPTVTTFGEPRVGNSALAAYIDARFPGEGYRRVTHVDDPVPLLPLREWHYAMHAGELFISKRDLPPGVADVERCAGDADPACVAAGERALLLLAPRFRLWQLFFAHRDYFWRLGLCVPGGDPHDWWGVQGM
ncbi:MAG: hypothetical protein M1832_005992 [Thelocarpon impressellum]|nr:MAG: hypothetical protein M1832_005992 [Thelocarpon impressellum]